MKNETKFIIAGTVITLSPFLAGVFAERLGLWFIVIGGALCGAAGGHFGQVLYQKLRASHIKRSR